jgi:hypothetical protein
MMGAVSGIRAAPYTSQTVPVRMQQVANLNQTISPFSYTSISFFSAISTSSTTFTYSPLEVPARLGVVIRPHERGPLHPSLFKTPAFSRSSVENGKSILFRIPKSIDVANFVTKSEQSRNKIFCQHKIWIIVLKFQRGVFRKHEMTALELRRGVRFLPQPEIPVGIPPSTRGGAGGRRLETSRNGC